MTNVKVSCPSCGKTGHIEVSEEIIKKSLRGLLAVNIPDNTICTHSFIAYIDKNLNIRDYFMADFQVELPKMDVPKTIEEKKIPLKDVVNLDLIKLNLSGILLTYVLKSIFSKKKMIIISNQDFLYDHVRNFLNYICQDTFEIDISMISKDDYKKDKKKYKDYIIFQDNKILRDEEKILNQKNIKVETQLVQNFLSEYDLSYSYILLKNEISKAFFLGKDLADYIKNLPLSEQKKLSIFDLSKHVTDYATNHNLKLHRLYLDFLVDVVINYFEIKVTKKADAKDFLKFV